MIILPCLRVFFFPTFLSRKLELAKGNIQTRILMKARNRNVNWVWWCTPVIRALEKGDAEDSCEFEATLSYMVHCRPALATG